MTAAHDATAATRSRALAAADTLMRQTGRVDDDRRQPWTLVVHLGLTAVAGAPVARYMRAERGLLSARGVQVLPPAGMQDLPARIDVAAAGGSHTSWVYAAGALDSSVAEVRALAQRVADRGGRVRAVLALASVHEIVDATTVRALRQGRANRAGFPTAKTVNYLPPLRRWQDALSDRVELVVPPVDATTSGIVEAIWDASGLPGRSPQPGRRDEPVRPRLSPVHAEAVRRVNIALAGPDTANLRHTAFRRAVALSRRDVPTATFALPVVDVAELAAAMAAEAETVLADIPAARRARLFDLGKPCPDVSGIDLLEAWELLRTDPGLRATLPEQPDELVAPVDRLRQAARRLAACAGERDPLTAARAAVEVHRLILDDPAVQVIGADDPTAGIPPQCFQYWEPLPPPGYMLEWFASWNRVGVPGGARLAGRDEARSVIDEVVGREGARAFDLATNPAMRSDLYRYAILLKMGGWYVDAEHEATTVVPLAIPVRRQHVFVSRPDGKFTSSFLGCRQGSPLVERVLEEAVARVVRSRGHGDNMTLAGPVLLTQMIHRYLSLPDANALVLPRRVAFHGVLQQIHHSAAYKVTDYWRDLQLGRSSNGPRSSPH